MRRALLSIYSGTIRHLDLGGNAIRDIGPLFMHGGFRKTSMLASLSLGENPLDAHSLQARLPPPAPPPLPSPPAGFTAPPQAGGSDGISS